MKIFKNNEVRIILVAILIFWLFELFVPYDDTDDIENRVRSSMSLYTDNLTGCQYLKGSFFAELTPRVNGSGQHIGCK